MPEIYVLFIVSYLAIIDREYKLPVAAYTTIDFCKSARDAYQTVEPSDHIKYRCVTVEVRR
jgi:hypothetical protein